MVIFGISHVYCKFVTRKLNDDLIPQILFNKWLLQIINLHNLHTSLFDRHKHK